MERPLISFVLTSYKQERFTREAVAGALAQTYSPLEIILSDDCSPDGTFAVMEEMARNYRGPHRVILNRNPQNLGLIAHLNKVIAMSQGEFIVPAAGDDISLPERAESIWRVWQASGGRARSIYTPVIEMQQDQLRTYKFVSRPEWNTLEHQLCTGFNNVLGASQCYHRSLFDVFGPLPATVAEEDHVLPFRAALLGAVVFHPVPLVKYRVHAANVSQSGAAQPTAQEKRAALARLLAHNKLPWLRAFREDLLTAHQKGFLSAARLAAHLRDLERVIEMDSGALQWLTGSLVTRVKSVCQMRRASTAKHPLPSGLVYLFAVALWPGSGAMWEKWQAARRRNS